MCEIKPNRGERDRGGMTAWGAFSIDDDEQYLRNTGVVDCKSGVIFSRDLVGVLMEPIG